jgi:ABC-type dipeptide/oligopeptide/nickel transport system permease component
MGARDRYCAHHLVLPAVTLTLFSALTRLMRASVLDQYAMDYVTTARAKVTERQIARRHVLRNARYRSFMAASGRRVARGCGVVRRLRSARIGVFAFESLFARDINLLLGIFFISGCLVVVVNLAVICCIRCWTHARTTLNPRARARPPLRSESPRRVALRDSLWSRSLR